eukprot:CAMPEP_0118939408 /NCGR_PEP_ID=MMETSP1169-20130426/28826_1 /TAXON_ID=36882 /ORGANISM="Pyramimonas obovata, Strain CCMP722" /LENGTH=190 /DNA_ID=CAMNT_0006883671 /DNA_START=33 /DNA_END=602 /DNA_ORIENTATION=-
MGDLGDKITAAFGSVPQVSALDDDMRTYVVELATSMLEDATEHGSTPADVKDELKEAIAPMLEEFEVPEDAVESLCTTLSKLLVSGDEEIEDDGKDYVVQLRDIRLGFGARMLLHKTDLILERNHRYGLVGENGIGKTTLLTRVVKGDIRGWPTHLKCVYVQHEVLAEASETVIHWAHTHLAYHLPEAVE